MNTVEEIYHFTSPLGKYREDENNIIHNEKQEGL